MSTERVECETGVEALAGCVLLAGALRPSALTLAAERSVLNLYLTEDRTVLGVWLERLAGLTELVGRPLTSRVVYDESGPAPTRAGVGSNDMVTFIKEERKYRGPAGALRDACADQPPDHSVLVADAARYVHGDLAPLLAEHLRRSADITVACEQDGSPSGIYMIRMRALELTPKSGFMDLKEQLLDRAVRQGMSVWVHRMGGRRSMPLRTRGQFLDAARLAAEGRDASGPARSDHVIAGAMIGQELEWRVVSDEADVDSGATVAASVVMPGAWIGEGAVVARSIVCPGARVEAGARVVDAVVSATGVRSDARSRRFSGRKNRP